MIAQRNINYLKVNRIATFQFFFLQPIDYRPQLYIKFGFYIIHNKKSHVRIQIRIQKVYFRKESICYFWMCCFLPYFRWFLLLTWSRTILEWMCCAKYGFCVLFLLSLSSTWCKFFINTFHSLFVHSTIYLYCPLLSYILVQANTPLHPIQKKGLFRMWAFLLPSQNSTTYISCQM